MESKDDRLIRENKDLEEQKELAEFLSKDIIFKDSWNVTNDKAVYIYLEMGEDGYYDKIWYIFNNCGQFYDVYENLDDIMLYIDHTNSSKRLYTLNHEQFTKLDTDH